MVRVNYTAAHSSPLKALSLRDPKGIRLSFKDAEKLIEHLLKIQGWEILSQNYRGHGFELDLVAKKARTLAIVEVKLRRNYDYFPFQHDEILNRRKRQALIKGARSFISKFQISGLTIRIDLAIVGERTVNYFPNVIETDSTNF